MQRPTARAQASHANGPFRAATKCSFKDGYTKFKKKVGENFLDKNTLKIILGTNLERMSEHGRDPKQSTVAQIPAAERLRAPKFNHLDNQKHTKMESVHNT